MEVGGDGSCGWRAISIQVALQNQRGTGATLDDMMDKVEILSTSLRVKTISFLKANKDRWMPDSKSTETTIVVWGWNGTDQPTHMPRMRQVQE